MSESGSRSGGFARNSALTLIQQVWSVLIGIITSVLLARGLGTEDRGTYTIILLLSSLIFVFFNSGLEPAIVYYTARSQNGVATMARASVALTTAAAIFALLLSYFVIVTGHDFLFPNTNPNLLLLALLLIPVMLYSNNLLILFRGIQDFKSFNLIEGISQPLNTGLVLLFVWVFHWGIFGAIAALLLRHVLAFCIGYFRLRPYLEKQNIFNLRVSRSLLNSIFTYGIKVYGYYIVVFLNQRVDVFMLSALAISKTSIALYDIAYGLGEKLWLISRAASIAIFSRVATLEGQSDQNSRLTQTVVRHIFWFSLIAGLVAGLLAEWGIVLLYGVDYQHAAIALRLILPGIVMLGTGHVISNDLAGRGKPETITFQSIFGILINIILNLVLIPRLSFAGAAIASSISYSIMTLLFAGAFCKATNTHLTDLFILQHSDFILWSKGLRWLRAKIIFQGLRK